MKVEKYYDRLTADERFRLLLAALSRDDNKEFDHLINAAPNKTYTMRDADVTDRLSFLEEIALRFSLALCDTVHWIERTRMTIHLLEWPPEKALKRWDDLEKLQNMLDRRWATLKAICASFKEFCLSENIDGHVLLKAYCEPALLFLSDAERLLQWHSKIHFPLKEKISKEREKELQELEKNYEEDKNHFDKFYEDCWGRFRKPQGGCNHRDRNPLPVSSTSVNSAG